MKSFFLTILFTLTGTVCLGQGSEQQRKLELRKAEIQKEIKALNSLINDEKEKEKSVLTKISDNNARIKLSEKLITTTQKQTRLLTDDIYVNQLKANKLRKELEVLKEDYANMLLRAYKSRSDQSRIMFILSSKSFLEAYKRVQYMKQYASFRKVQGDEIRAKMAELDSTLEKLGVQKKDKEILLAESNKEKRTLEQDRVEQEKLVKTIQKDKKKYAGEVSKKQKESKDIERRIDKMIRDAIAEANRKAVKKATASGSSSSASTVAAAAKASPNKIVLTKEGKVVSDNFKSNKGHLPWPVEKGYISVGYGTQPHPVMKNLEIHNSGIDITTEPGATVRAVFGGEVMSVQVISGSGNKIVYVQHGDYITVYYNLASVSVSTGDKVSLKQTVGTAGRNPATGEAVVKFLVLQNTTYLNPTSWIAAQ